LQGRYPDGTLLRDGAGALIGEASYGGAHGYGTLFELTPPLPGTTAWSLSVLHNFTGGLDGGVPNANLVMGPDVALYGTAAEGGRYDEGVVFRLQPPMPGRTQWTETVLHDFDYSLAYGTGDGKEPHTGLIITSGGVLYGTTIHGGTTADPFAIGFGTVFQLTPPTPQYMQWKETVLYRFKGGNDGQEPYATLTPDGSGALYGTRNTGGSGKCVNELGSVIGCGTIFKLTPPAPGQTNWTKVTLHQFTNGADGGVPRGKLHLDRFGFLYGTTTQGGKGQCVDQVGNVIGCGTAFKLAPPAPGQSGWTEIVVHYFMGIPDGTSPFGGLIVDTAGHLPSIWDNHWWRQWGGRRVHGSGLPKCRVWHCV
jgi:hypothetical protein